MYLIFDIETIIDDDLIYETNKMIVGEDNKGLIWEPREPCVARAREKACKAAVAAGKECFIPEQYQVPVVATMLIMGASGEYIAHDVMDAAGPRGVQGLTERFWHNMQIAVDPPTMVQRWIGFNSKKFDGPVMVNQALRFGIPIPKWLPGFDVKAWEDPRNEMLSSPHVDMFHQFSGSKFTAQGSMSYWARLLGLPGKTGVSGDQVGEMWKAGKVDDITDYCLTDVLNTAGLLLGYLRAQGHPVGPRSPEFEATMIKVCESRPGSKIMETFWKAFRPTCPF